MLFDGYLQYLATVAHLLNKTALRWDNAGEMHNQLASMLDLVLHL
jgi:hypothetical protein